MKSRRYVYAIGYIKEEWLLHDGRRHREDGPAIIHTNGGQLWYLLGKQHRIDGPAVVDLWSVPPRRWWCVRGEYLPGIEEYLISTEKILEYMKKCMEYERTDLSRLKAVAELAIYHSLLTDEQAETILSTQSLRK